MANNTINTRIILKNDSTANWTAKDPVLLKGEVGFDLDLGIFKVGDGVKKWSEITVTYSNLQDILATIDQKIQDAVGDLHQTQVFEADVENGGDKMAAIATAVGESPLYKGDIAIVKEAITGDKKEYTAYVYNGTTWAAMDGNYNASNVIFDKDFVATYQFGKYKPDASGSVTIPASGKSILSMFMNSYAEEQDPTITQPTVSLALTGAGRKEVGTKFTPSFTVTFNKGKYSFGPDTGVTATFSTTDTNNQTFEGATGSFAEFTVAENTNYKATVTATYTDGVNPVSNLGTEVPSKKIVGGTKTATSSAVVGYRGWFQGYYNGTQHITDPTAITSAQLRAFGVKDGAFTTSNYQTNQMQQMFFAAPAGVVKSVAIANAVNGAPLTVQKSTVNVEGANGFAAAEYDLFYVSNAVAESGASKWNITVTK